MKRLLVRFTLPLLAAAPSLGQVEICTYQGTSSEYGRFVNSLQPPGPFGSLGANLLVTGPRQVDLFGSDCTLVQSITSPSGIPPTSSPDWGSVACGLVDSDGNGSRNVLIGDPHFASLPGTAGWVGVYDTLSGVLLQSINSPFVSADDSRFGATVLEIGDLDGDGTADFAVGAPRAASPGGVFTGGVAFFSGMPPYDALSSILGSASGQEFGNALALAGDMNGDGVAEILIGAPAPSTDQVPGRVRIFDGTGANYTDIQGPGGIGGLFGASVASIDDVNGGPNPGDDALIGEPGLDRAHVFVLYTTTVGRQVELDAALLLTLQGPSGSAFGRHVSALGDVNGDGIRDFAIGAPAGNFVDVYSGRSPHFNLLFTVTGDASHDVGHSIAGLSDLNGDGCADVLIGFTGKDINDSGLYKVYGR